MKINPLLRNLPDVFLILIVWRILWVIRFIFPAMIPLVLLFLAGYWICSKFKNNKENNDNADGEHIEYKFRG
jgi:flagellar biogenesis protein FliO